MKPEISIVMPAIRPTRWLNFYKSVCESTVRSFELIIVSPYPLPKELEQYKNIRLVRDFGKPSRCANIGLLLCEGNIFFGIMADDATLLKGALDKGIDLLISMGPDPKNVVSCRSVEGVDGTEKTQQSIEYYRVNGSTATSSPFVPNDWLIMNGAIAYTSYIQHMGGWDTMFEGLAMAVTDLAIRCQMYGSKFQFCNEIMFDLDHMPGTTGDHAPIHYSQIMHDEPAFKAKYNRPLSEIEPRIQIMNWRNADNVWKKRF